MWSRASEVPDCASCRSVIEGRGALVTGASKGIGYGIAKALAAEGAKVAVASRSEEHLEQAAATVPGAEAFVHDVSDPAAGPDLIDSVEDRLGPVEILTINIGGPTSSGRARP